MPTQAEVGVLLPQIQGYLEPPKAGSSEEGFSPRTAEEPQP